MVGARILVLDPTPGRPGETAEVLLEHRMADNQADGSTTTFSFPGLIGDPIAVFLGGIPQLPDQVSCDQLGNVTLGTEIAPPSEPVTCLGLFPIYAN